MKKKCSHLPPILRNFALIVILLSLFSGSWLLYNLFQDENIERDCGFIIFIITSVVLHLFVGIAIFSKKRWGFFVFKCYLYIMLLAIPIGTYISQKILHYIEENNIKNIYN